MTYLPADDRYERMTYLATRASGNLAADEAATDRAAATERIGRRDRLGGLIHEYYPIAA
jgi:hypothetical protein